MREYVKKNYGEMKARMAAKRQEIADWKRARGCSVCEESEPWVLDMHHLDPEEKERNPAQSATLKTFLKEADKCVLLCSNCHRKVHAGVLKLSKKHIDKFRKSLSYGMRQGKKDSDDANKAKHYAQKLREELEKSGYLGY